MKKNRDKVVLILRKSLFHFLCYLEQKEELIILSDSLVNTSDVLSEIQKQPLGYIYQKCFYADEKDA